MQSHYGNALPRLYLHPISIASLQSELNKDGALSTHLSAEITTEWPPEDWEPHVLELLLETLSRDSAQADFHRYVLLARGKEPPILIGSVGAFFWPGAPNEVEFGYAVLPAFRRRGFATEAARQHLEWLKTRPEVHSVFAQTYPDLTASIRILQTLGFTSDGSGREPGTIAFRLRL